MVDLNADIVPGISAAGFRIGQTLAEIEAAELRNGAVFVWDRSRGALGSAIELTDGWLLCDARNLTMPERGGTLLWYNRGAVNLHCNADGVLYEISVWQGYSGRFADVIQIGDRLDKVLAFTNLIHDSGDEAHYPVEENLIRGIGFIAEDTPLDNSPDQIIRGISVHNWALQ